MHFVDVDSHKHSMTVCVLVREADQRRADLTPSKESMPGARILALGVTEGVESHAAREEDCGRADHRQAA